MTHALLRILRSLGVSSASALAASCSTFVPPPNVDLAGTQPLESWSRVLGQHVDERGTIDFDGLAADSGDLDIMVAWIADPSSGGQPPGPARIAHLCNAYNALAMYNVLHGGVMPKKKASFFYFRTLAFEGGRISLYDLENDVIRPLGEPRIHFALNCMVRSCPRLPREPFDAIDAARFEEQLDAAAREFFNDPQHVELWPEEGKVLFSAILEWYEEDFLTVAPSLVAYANRYRTQPIPEDWEVGFREYDWTLNAPAAK